MPAVCEGGEIIYTRLLDGNHTFEVCTNGSLGVGCAHYNWTVGSPRPLFLFMILVVPCSSWYLDDATYGHTKQPFSSMLYF